MTKNLNKSPARAFEIGANPIEDPQGAVPEVKFFYLTSKGFDLV